MRIMFCLVLVALLGLTGDSFAMEEVEEPSEIDTPIDYDEIINRQGSEEGFEGVYNTFYGTGAGHAMLTNPDPPPNPGQSNTFIGSQAGYTNETGWANTFVGRNAGYNATSGGNTFIGYYAGLSNTIEEGNTFVGANAGEKNGGEHIIGNGEDNSFFGRSAGYSNTYGDCNSFFGKDAGYSNTTGDYNSFFGKDAGYSNTTGSVNSFFGRNAGYSNTIGHHNSFIGEGAGRSNYSGSDNSFLGALAGRSNNGSSNSFFGKSAGYSNTYGNYNSFFGNDAGFRTTTGSENTFIGYEAGYSNTTGSGNVYIGNKAGGFDPGASNKLYIDNTINDIPLIWGDFVSNSIVIYGNFRAIATSDTSDVRLKKNIRPLESSLNKISNLQGVNYEWKTDEYPDFGLNEGKQIGLIAQDVEKELPELVSEDKDGYKAVSYTKLTAVLVEAVKELKAQNERQQVEIQRLRALIQDSKNL